MASLDPGSFGDPVSLRPMTSAEFLLWRERSVSSYGRDIARASGLSAADAIARAEEQVAELLPDDERTAGHWLLHVLDSEGGVAGSIWVGPHPRRPDGAWVYDISIESPRRGEGLGRAAMRLAERLAAGAGRTELGLSVFGFNGAARALYDSLDYRVVATQMTKTLSV